MNKHSERRAGFFCCALARDERGRAECARELYNSDGGTPAAARGLTVAGRDSLTRYLADIFGICAVSFGDWWSIHCIGFFPYIRTVFIHFYSQVLEKERFTGYCRSRGKDITNSILKIIINLLNSFKKRRKLQISLHYHSMV